MGFLKRLFGAAESKPYIDKQGLYFYVKCGQCGSKVRVRADKQHDLNRVDGGYVWHKTIVDSHCFRQIPVVIQMDNSYRVTRQQIEGGEFISAEQYEQPEPAGDAPDD